MWVQTLAYRRDVDGLRAIAVLAVVAFHSFPSVFPGGFVGVDIFFVISGFLITGILLNEAHEGRFSIANFYARRIRRIFPALVLVLAAVFFAEWYLLLPQEFQPSGRITFYSSLFSANLALMQGVGYFEPFEHLNPLLHLWSLGVEEQFYIIWPILIFLGVRLKLRPFGWIAGLAVLSFALNIWWTHQNAAMNFYNPISRFWELLLGAGLTVARPSGGPLSGKLCGAASIVGAVLIGMSIVFVNEAMAYPGGWALLPTSGAVLLIAAGETAIVNRSVLSCGPMVFVGLISYPLYLWHWPLFTFSRLLGVHTPPVWLVALLICSAFALAILTYYLVELNLRHKKSKVVVASLVAGSLVIAMMGQAGQHKLLPTRAFLFEGLQVHDIVAAEQDWDSVEVFDALKPGQPTTLFIGDSYMQQYLPRIQRVSRGALRGVAMRARGGCAPFQGFERIQYTCAKFVDQEFARAAAPDVDRVVIAAAWSGYRDAHDYYDLKDPNRRSIDVLHSNLMFDRLTATIARLRRSGKQVAIVLDIPSDESSGPAARLTRNGLGWDVLPQHVINLAEFDAASASSRRRVEMMAAETGAKIIDPALYLCSGGLCETGSQAGVPYFFNASHLRATFVREKVTFLDAWIR
jgi:peptidoglycan/LPS O-acetylase OafA/YrhL